MNRLRTNPLISIIIYVYNSKDYIVETLNSVKAQTYSNIELIVTDDLSTDNTLEIVEKWLIINEGRFISSKIIRTKTNTGIAGNNNRGLAAATGDWVKFVPGDDLLLPNAVTSLVNGISDSEIGFIYSNAHLFRNNIENVISTKGELISKPESLSLLKENKILAMTTLIKKSVLKNLGGFDERYPMIDDWPLWLKLAEHNVKFAYVNEITAGYRKHDSNISKTGFSKKYLQSWFSFSEDHLIPKGIKRGLYSLSYNRIVYKTIFNLQKNTTNPYLIKATNVLNFLDINFLRNFVKMKFNTLSEKRSS